MIADRSVSSEHDGAKHPVALLGASLRTVRDIGDVSTCRGERLLTIGTRILGIAVTGKDQARKNNCVLRRVFSDTMTSWSHYRS